MTSARQERGGVSAARAIDAVILGALLLSLVISAWMIWTAFRRGPVALGSAAGLQLYLWAALVINALLCANLSGVFGRYQGRLAWLLPVLVAVTLAARPAPPLRSASTGE